ncbi:MAG: substrate-binding domain-containing protein, partial [bacterium]|nr:substrate-binding domain-containing protein [bacterium]
LDGFFGSTEHATLGPLRAVLGRGLAGKVKLVGFDYGESIEQGLEDGVVDAVVVQDPFNIGYTAVKTMVAKLNGGTPPRRIDSPARLITREDLADPEIQRYLHPDLAR